MAYPKNPPFMALSPNHTPKLSQQGRPIYPNACQLFSRRSNSPVSRAGLFNSRREQIRNILINKFRTRFNTFEN